MMRTRNPNLFAWLLVALFSATGIYGCCEDITLVTVPGGTFTMGSPVDEPGRGDDETQHPVTLSSGFQMTAHEVTQCQFQEVMGYNPSKFRPLGTDATHPVEQVSWYDALAYANKKSEADGLDACFVLSDIVCADDTPGDASTYCRSNGGIAEAVVALDGVSSVYDCDGYRLPTESEWEHAARAGTSTAVYTGDLVQRACTPVDPLLDAIGWYCGNAGQSTHEVGGKIPNAWGLYDVIGNVLEWCWDGYASTYPGPATDPEGDADAYFRVVRGGSAQFDGAARCRSAHRGAHTPGFRDRFLGFRIVRTAPGAPSGEDMTVAATAPGATTAPAASATDYPSELPFPFTRPDVGTPLTPEEIATFTQKITGAWKDVGYFNWVAWTSHGMDASNPYGMPDYKLYWQDTRAIKSGDVVTFEHFGGADNLALRTCKILNNAAASYLMSGDAAMGRIVELYSKGLVALVRGMIWGDDDPEPAIMARAIFTQDHAYTQDGRDTVVSYGPVKQYKFDWNAHTVPNPDNPYWGDIWVRTMRSKDDVPHILRSVPLLMRVAVDGPDADVLDAAALAVDTLKAFSLDVVESGYYIRTKDLNGNVWMPRNEFDAVNDLASYMEYVGLVPNAECNNRLVSALVAVGDPLDVDCGNGIGGLYEFFASLRHYFNWAIIRYFHVAAITNALMVEQNDVALGLLEGLADRVDAMMAGEGNWEDYPEWDSDVASYLLVAATAGLPLTSAEARLVMEQYSLAADHYEAWGYWDLWDPSVPDGTLNDYKPSRSGPLGTVVRPTELAYLIEYCYSPFRNETGAELVDCDIVADPSRWGE